MIDAAGVAYRDATTDDAEMLAALARETFIATFAHLYAIADLNVYLAATYGADIQGAELADPLSRHRLAFHQDEAIGYAKMGAFKLPAAPIGAHVRELHRLYVREAAKGKGVADALMRWTIDVARADGADALYLGVYQHNERAQRFYARYGFEIVGEYWYEVGRTRDPEYIMRAPL